MKRSRIAIVALALIGLITACASPEPTVTAPVSGGPPSSPSPQPLPSPTALPTSTPTPILPKEFTVCQALEPNTLFIYGKELRVVREVKDLLEAIQQSAAPKNEPPADVFDLPG